MSLLKEHPLSLDTQATLLLCGQLSKKSEKSGMQPLTPPEYASLTQWLQKQHLRLADLLETSVALKLKHLEHEKITPSRLLALLMQRVAMTLALENWTKKGLWVISPSDEAYPIRLKTRLGQWAPPLFYGVGHAPLLQKGGIAILGSHEIVDEHHLDFTKKLAKISAQQSMVVISRGTRGVDTEALFTALAQGRCAVGVLIEGLVKAMMSSKYRNALQEERLVLISPLSPEENLGHTSVRSRCIYGLADAVVIVNRLEQEGELWSGAVENLKNKWVPLYVYQTTYLGNQSLLEQGAIPMDKTVFQPSTDLQQLLLANKRVNEKIFEEERSDSQKSVNAVSTHSKETRVTPPPLELETDLFYVVWPHIERQLSIERTEEELAEQLSLHPKQLKIWLNRALELGKIIKLNKPVRYISVFSSHPGQPSLF